MILRYVCYVGNNAIQIKNDLHQNKIDKYRLDFVRYF